MLNCQKTDTGSLKPPDLREPCKLTPGHGGLCSWHPAFGKSEGREVVTQVRINLTPVGGRRYTGCTDTASAITRALEELKPADRNAAILTITATRGRANG